MAVLPVTGSGEAPQPPADVSALYEVQVVPIVAARPHQDAQEVQVVAEVLQQRRPGAEDARADSADEGITDDSSLVLQHRGTGITRVSKKMNKKSFSILKCKSRTLWCFPL